MGETQEDLAAAQSEVEILREEVADLEAQCAGMREALTELLERRVRVAGTYIEAGLRTPEALDGSDGRYARARAALAPEAGKALLERLAKAEERALKRPEDEVSRCWVCQEKVRLERASDGRLVQVHAPGCIAGPA